MAATRSLGRQTEEFVYNVWYMVNRRSTSRKTSKKKTSSSARSRARAKEVAPEHELPGGFWRQVLAVLMLVLAVVFIFNWLGDGGPVLQAIDEGIYYGIGAAEFLIPAILVWLAVKIFRSEDNRIPMVMWFTSVLMIIWTAGLAGVSGYGTAEATGGVVGTALNDAMFQIGNAGVAIFIYIVLIFVTAMFILQTNPVTVFRAIGRMFNTSAKEEKKAAKNAAKAAKRGKKEEADETAGKGDDRIKVNKGVAIDEEGAENEKPLVPLKTKLGMMGKLGRGAEKAEKTAGNEKLAAVPGKAAGASVTAPDPDRALVAVSDPNWKMPSLNLLEKKQSPANPGDIQQNAHIIKTTLSEFGIDVEMEGANVGPRVTQYTMRPPAGVNLSKILARDKELALNLAVDKIRIEAPIPGTRLVGVELPNERSADVRLRSVLESQEWKKATEPLTFAVGKDISGKSVVANLAKMPHLLIAGTTGSGKSVMTNTLISSLLYRNAPSDMKLIIVDPKQVEMAQYDGIPHLLTPIITQVEKALSALKWAVNEMEKRYTIMAEERVKNIVDYNAKMAKKAEEAAKAQGEGGAKEGVPEVRGEQMPYIVILIDEMADLMMMAGKDLELPIVRIAQKGRAAGIHLVLATQRPEVKVITGLIKANIPGKIAFAVGSQVDSRVMLDATGAEKLLGKGDMLMLTTEMMGKPRRIQGAWASDEDVAKVTDFLRAQRAPEYNNEVVAQQVSIKGVSMGGEEGMLGLGRKYDPNDPVVRKAIEITLKQGKFSTASLQTWLGKGHGFVSGLAIWLEEIGVIGPANGHKPRDVLISSMEEFEQLANAGEV